MTALWIPRVLLSFAGAEYKSLLGKFKYPALILNNQRLSPRLREAPRAAASTILNQHGIMVHAAIGDALCLVQRQMASN